MAGRKLLIEQKLANRNRMKVWGIDLGGTKIEGVVLEPENDYNVLVRERIPTEGHGGYDHIIGRVQQIIANLADKVGSNPEAIGIGTPGVIDANSGLMKNSNSTALNGRPFHKDLQSALNIPVRMANDANCFALAETKMGAVADIKPHAKLVFGVIMGTGVGGGIIINGQVHDGIQGIGGEWGHSYLDESGGKCYCGNIGCVETIISGPALERYYGQQSGKELKLAEIMASRGQDEFAEKTADRLLHYFGRGLANVINILDPDVVVLGGGLSQIDALYTEGVERLSEYVFNTSLETKIVRPKLGDSAGVFGAALLVS